MKLFVKRGFVMTREEQLKREYESKLAALRAEQSSCKHEWEEVKYDPETINEPRYETRWQGVDCFPEIVGYREKTVARWSRTCRKCGKVEYTKEQVAVKYELKF